MYQHHCLFQPPVDYGSLNVTREHRTQDGYFVHWICYFSARLYTREEEPEEGCRLAVYSVSEQDSITLLDTLELEVDEYQFICPSFDRQSGRVYIPCGRHGIRVVRYDGSKLVPVTTLRCMEYATGLAVVSADTLYICDGYTVCLVDVTQDRVTDKLQAPEKYGVGYSPCQIALLGDTLLVMYSFDSFFYLAISRHCVPMPGKMLRRQPKLSGDWYTVLTTDHHSNFLLPNQGSDDSNVVYVFDINGNLTHTIPIPEDKDPTSCTVVRGQLWIACGTEIIVMSSQ